MTKGQRLGDIVGLGGIVAAVVLAILANVFSARHPHRWDFTRGKRYTLSDATRETLRSLDERVEIWVVLPAGDPLEASLKQTVAAYQAESAKLDVHFIDPDRDVLALVELQHRFHLEAGRSEDGRVTTDAVVVVARGERRWFLTPNDLFEAAEGDNPRARPHEEQALTGALRAVLGGEKTRLCFTTGHGELPLEPSQRGWVGDLRRILERDNYEAVPVDTTSPNAHDPFKDCTAVVVAGLATAFGKDETQRLRTYLLEGGNALITVGPVFAEATGPVRFATSGLTDALSPFGIAIDDNLVIDTDPSVALAAMHGEAFFATVKAHAVTRGLLEDGSHPAKVVMVRPSSLRRITPDGAAMPIDILGTTKGAAAVRKLEGDAKETAGPFVVAMASERPKLTAKASHGPRLVVVGSSYALAEPTWTQPRPVRGGAMLVENALSWLVSRPPVLDVPERPWMPAGVRITEQSRVDVRNYVLVYMPLAAALLALAVGLRRRATEDRP